MLNHHSMKRALYIVLIVTAASCKRDPLITYNSADNVYFNFIPTAGQVVDSTSVSFAYLDAGVKDTVLSIPVAVTGVPAAADRPFTISVDPSSTAQAGTHYDLPQAVIHARQVTDTVRLHLKRSPDLASGSRRLVLRLQPNDYFKTQLQYKMVNGSARDTVPVLTFSIMISDHLDKGLYWDSDYAGFFGAFSLKKVTFIHDLLGMPLDFWSVSADNQRRAAAVYYAATTSRYLGDQAALGNIIYDEDGTPMQMGPGY